jgi:hypothetical protein
MIATALNSYNTLLLVAFILIFQPSFEISNEILFTKMAAYVGNSSTIFWKYSFNSSFYYL